MTVHDDVDFNVYPGMVIQQGDQIGNMGMAGNADGVHCHFQTAQTEDRSWYKNGYGNYQFNNEVDPENVCFMDNTEILGGVGAWKYLKDVPVNEPKPQPQLKPENTTSKEIEKLKKQLDEKQKKIDVLNAQVKALEKENTLLKQQKEALQSEFNAYKESASKVEKEEHRLLFIAPRTDLYYIQLEENQELYI